MRSPIRSEIIKVLALTLLLALGVGYLTLIDKEAPAPPADVLNIYADARSLDSLKLALEGRVMPTLNARNAVTGQIESMKVAEVSLIIPISGNACTQSHVGALRRVQALHRAVGEKIPVRVVMVTEVDAEAARMQALLYRKAIRPTFELWYASDESLLMRTVSSERLEPVLVVSDGIVNSVLHAVEHNRIEQTVADLLASSS